MDKLNRVKVTFSCKKTNRAKKDLDQGVGKFSFTNNGLAFLFSKLNMK